jgi:hypothetical protein
MIKQLQPSILLFGVVSFCFAGTVSAAPQDTTSAGVMLPTVNGALFTSGPVTVDNAHCGWNYVLGGGAFYAAQVPSASGFPVRLSRNNHQCGSLADWIECDRREVGYCRRHPRMSANRLGGHLSLPTADHGSNRRRL